MKYYFIILIFVATLLCSVSSQISADRTILEIKVDPRIELLAVVQLISNYGERYQLISRYDYPYKRDVAEYFSPYDDHAVVDLFIKMSIEGFNFDAPPTAMLYLSEPPNLEIMIPFTDYLNKRAGGGERLIRFVENLRDFCIISNFNGFYETHKGTYMRSIELAKNTMGSIDYIGALESYFGLKNNSYTIILAPLFHPGGFGPRMKREDNTYDIYNICGPMGLNNGIPTFGDASGFEHLVWHEFGHSFVNPIMETYEEQIERYSLLFDPTAEIMKKQAYDNWKTCVNEHVVRAITARLVFLERGKEAGAQALINEKRKGFFYIDELCESLKQYENNRDEYPSFADYAPKLINVFKMYSEKELDDAFYMIPFTGCINNVVTDNSNVVLIIPTHESNHSDQENINAYVKDIQTKFFPDSPVITDEQALSTDLSSNSIIVYGTITGNKWLAKYFGELPVVIEEERIIANKVYSGLNLRFISSWPNPFNPEKGMLIYTAQRAEDIVDINSVHHGPTDYVLTQGRGILHDGDYDKTSKKWKF